MSEFNGVSMLCERAKSVDGMSSHDMELVRLLTWTGSAWPKVFIRSAEGMVDVYTVYAR